MKKQSKRLVRNPGFSLAMEVEVRRQGQPLQRYTLNPQTSAAFAELFLQAASWDGAGDPLPKALRPHAKILEEAGVLVAEDAIPPVVEPDVAIDVGLLDWVPERARLAYSAAGTMRVNREIVLQPGVERPALGTELPPAAAFPQGPGLVWVRDASTLSWAAYRPPAPLFAKVKRLKAGRMTVGALLPAERALLAHARILVAARPDRTRSPNQSANRLAKDGYFVIRSMLPPLVVAQLRRYFAALEQGGYLTATERKISTSRLSRHNDVVADYLLHQSAALIRALTREPVMPSFNWVARYLPGAALPRHTDREQCSWNVSCVIESQHGLDVDKSWPICVKAHGARHDVLLDFGDAILYQGRTSPHWRPPALPGQEQTLLLLFYVPVDFKGDLR